MTTPTDPTPDPDATDEPEAERTTERDTERDMEDADTANGEGSPAGERGPARRS
ncbi:MAG: hypothetical protein ABW195_06355 [Ilumatobacteraceae bacterium]